MKKRKRILVIDDEKEIRNILCETFQEFGFETIEAENGEFGIAAIDKKNPPDIIITDILMPQKEGLETIREIKQSFPSVKLIAMSGGGGRQNFNFLDAARKFGADKTITKPLDIEELEKIVAGF